MSSAALLLLLALLPARADDADGDRYYYEEIYAPFFAPDPDKPGYVRNVRPGSNRASFPARKEKGALRVFVAGGSTAGGYRDLGALGWGLERALPGRKIEAINVGMSGYDSARVQLVLEEVARYEPDVVVVFPGHNDFYLRHGPPPPRRTVAALRALGRYSWFRELRRRRAGAVGVEKRLKPEVRRAALEGLLRNLTAHVKTIEGAGARAVIVAAPLEYLSSAPGEVAPPWGDRGYVDGWLAFVRGRDEEAARLWTRRLKDGGETDDLLAAFLWHGVARARGRQGRRDDERAAYERSLDFAAGADFCAPSCMKAELELARAKGALAVDGDAAFRAATAPRLPGPESFVDEIHWAAKRHVVLTRALISAMKADARLKDLGWNEKADLSEAAVGLFRGDLHPKGALFFATQKVELSNRFSQRALEWLAGAESLRPKPFASFSALAAAAQDAYDAYDNRRPGQFSSPLPTRRIPEDRLEGYYGALRLEQGRWDEAEKALGRAAAVESRFAHFRLLHGAALALKGDKKRAREALEDAGDDLPEEAKTFAEALGLGPLAAAVPGQRP